MCVSNVTSTWAVSIVHLSYQKQEVFDYGWIEREAKKGSMGTTFLWTYWYTSNSAAKLKYYFILSRMRKIVRNILLSKSKLIALSTDLALVCIAQSFSLDEKYTEVRLFEDACHFVWDLGVKLFNSQRKIPYHDTCSQEKWCLKKSII